MDTSNESGASFCLLASLLHDPLLLGYGSAHPGLQKLKHSAIHRIRVLKYPAPVEEYPAVARVRLPNLQAYPVWNHVDSHRIQDQRLFHVRSEERRVGKEGRYHWSPNN